MKFGPGLTTAAWRWAAETDSSAFASARAGRKWAETFEVEDIVRAMCAFFLFGGLLILCVGVPQLILDFGHPELWNEGIHHPLITGSVVAFGVAMLLGVVVVCVPSNRPLHWLAMILALALFAGSMVVSKYMQPSHRIDFSVDFSRFEQKQTALDGAKGNR